MEQQHIEYKLSWKNEFLKNVCALREALFNAVIHRDYNSTSSILVRIYKDRISFMNEGLFPPEVQIEDLKREQLSKPRNLLIADIFYKCGLIESWERGTLKILKECRAANLPEPLFTEHNGVITTTIFGFESEKVNNAGDNFSKTSRFILKEMSENPRISISELAKILNIHIRNIEKNVAQLKKNKIIERIGSPKKGYWKINNK